MTKFGKRLKAIGIEEKTQNKIHQITGEAGKEFPCLSCPSKDECNSSKWFLKWFGTPK